MSFFNTRRKYLLLIPIIFLLINAFYNINMIEDVKEALLQEKFTQTINSIEMLAATIEAAEMPPRDYSVNIVRAVNFLDSLDSTFAAAYIYNDGEWELKTIKNYTTDFCPFQYSDFIDKIENFDRGQLLLEFCQENSDCREMYLYFRFMPYYASYYERVLVVSAVSQHGVTTIIPTLLGFGQWISTTITFIINVILMILFMRVAWLYDAVAKCKDCFHNPNNNDK